MDDEILSVNNMPVAQKISLRRKRKPNLDNNLKSLQENKIKKQIAQELYYAKAATLPVKVKEESTDVVVKENLKGLEQNKRKKQNAQKLYYKNLSGGQSPMTRVDVFKGPVHTRLGQKIRLFRKRVAPQDGIVTKKYKYMVQKYNGPRLVAQRRLEKLRQNLSGKPSGIVLRRKLIPNLTVQVNNPNALQMPRHSVQASIDQALKQQIQEIQSSAIPEPIGNESFHIFARCTHISMTTRFSNLP